MAHAGVSVLLQRVAVECIFTYMSGTPRSGLTAEAAEPSGTAGSAVHTGQRPVSRGRAFPSTPLYFGVPCI